MKELLDEAISLAAAAHAGQFDLAGRPYILHPLHVMHSLMPTSDTEMIIAVLHDIIEDTDTTYGELKRIGFGYEITDALLLLTHQSTDRYEDYIKSLILNNYARSVKIADLEHNMDMTRIKRRLTNGDLVRVAKYHEARRILIEG
jgi:(p)ppGpp synthase/HD superfamily hydrolase